MKHLEYLLCSVSYYYVCYYYVIIFAIMLAITVCLTLCSAMKTKKKYQTNEYHQEIYNLGK